MLLGCKFTKHCKNGGGLPLNKLNEAFFLGFHPLLGLLLAMTGSFTHLLEEDERLVAKSFFESSGLMHWTGGFCLNNPSFFLLFASVFCGLGQEPCRGLLTSVSVDNLRLRLVVTYACLSSKLRCYIVTLLHCYVLIFSQPRFAEAPLLWRSVLT